MLLCKVEYTFVHSRFHANYIIVSEIAQKNVIFAN